MTAKAWMRVALLAAAVAIAGPAPAAPIPAAVPASAPAPLPDVQQYIARLAATLKDRKATQAQRDQAAERLAEVPTRQSRDAITQALSGADDRGQLAAARGIVDSAKPDPAWVSPLTRLIGHGAAINDAAARALAGYDTTPRAYEAMLQFARSRQPVSLRVAVIRALGQVVQKPVGEFLLAAIGDRSEAPAIRAAAAEALGHLSGQTTPGQNVNLWSQWWNARKNLALAAWRTLVVAEQHAELQRLDERAREDTRQSQRGLQEVLSDEYQREPTAAGKAGLLLRSLDNENPHIRAAGAALVPPAIFTGQPIPDAIHSRLIDLVGDASPDVRLQVALALSSLADPKAVGAVVTQLQLENDNDVKVQLCNTVSRLGDARAVPVLLSLLHDPSPRVVLAAATALRALGVANQAFQQLQQEIRQTGPPGKPVGDPASQAQRTALVEATVPVAASGDPDSTLDFYNGLLNQAESPQTRQAALEALGTLGERAGSVIAQELDPQTELDAPVRQSAALALGATGSFIFANRLNESTRPNREPDRDVREAAWRAFQTLLPSPSATTHELSDWADLFHRSMEYDREIVVREELCKKLRDDPQNLAVEEQRTGELQLQLGQAEPAIPHLSRALTYWESHHARPETTYTLVRKLTQAYLKNKQYHEAARFAEQQIKIDPKYQEEVGPALRDEASQLIQKGDSKEAGTLIREALNMNPPLDERYRDQMQDLRTRLPAAAQSPSNQ